MSVSSIFRNPVCGQNLKRATARSGLPEIRIHDLRHSHASMLIDMKFSIKEISDRLGHESPETTWKVYAHLYPGKDRKLADALNEVRATNDNAEDKRRMKRTVSI